MITAETASPSTIDEYISGFPNDVRQLLEQMRSTIRKAAPKAEEAIKYRMPTLVLNGNLVHFAAFAHHIGFYPTASGIANFKEQFSAYKYSKGAVQFPLDKPLPLTLVAKIVKFRAKENAARAAAKKK